MKKSMILVAMASMMMASCVQDESLENQEVLSSAPKGITFHTVVAKQKSRALVDGVVYPTDVPFGAWARYNPSDENLNVGYQNYITNAKIQYFPATNNNSVAYWGLTTPEYWPDRGSLTFFAYSPFEYQEDKYQAEGYNNKDKYLVDSTKVQAYSPQVGNHGVVFPDYDVHNHQKTDLMVADVVKGLKANITNNTTAIDSTQNNPTTYTGVPTKFRHKLAKIEEFIVQTSDDYDGTYDGNDNLAIAGEMRFFIEKIELLNLKTKGTYYGETYKKDGSLVADRWVDPTQQANKDYTWFDAKEVYDSASDEQRAEGWVDVTEIEKTQNNTGTVAGETETHYGVEFGHSLTKALRLKNINIEQEYERNPTIDNKYLLVIPQTFNNDQQIRVTYYVKTFETTETDEGASLQAGGRWVPGKLKVVTRYLSEVHGVNAKWPMNAKITYTLLFSTEEIRWAPYVRDWTTFDDNVVDF